MTFPVCHQLRFLSHDGLSPIGISWIFCIRIWRNYIGMELHNEFLFRLRNKYIYTEPFLVRFSFVFALFFCHDCRCIKMLDGMFQTSVEFIFSFHKMCWYGCCYFINVSKVLEILRAMLLKLFINMCVILFDQHKCYPKYKMLFVWIQYVTGSTGCFFFFLEEKG